MPSVKPSSRWVKRSVAMMAQAYTNAAVRAKKEQAAKETPVYEPDADEAESEAEEKEEYTYGDVLEDFGDEEESADKDDTVEEIDEPETIEENVEIKTDDEDKKE